MSCQRISMEGAMKPETGETSAPRVDALAARLTLVFLSLCRLITSQRHPIAAVACRRVREVAVTPGSAQTTFDSREGFCCPQLDHHVSHCVFPPCVSLFVVCNPSSHCISFIHSRRIFWSRDAKTTGSDLFMRELWLKTSLTDM